MDPKKPLPHMPDDSAFPHIDDIHTEVVAELPGQEIAKRAAEREDLMRAAQARGVDAIPLVLLTVEMMTLRAKQTALRAQSEAAVAAVLERYGRGRK